MFMKHLKALKNCDQHTGYRACHIWGQPAMPKGDTVKAAEQQWAQCVQELRSMLLLLGRAHLPAHGLLLVREMTEPWATAWGAWWFHTDGFSHLPLKGRRGKIGWKKERLRVWNKHHLNKGWGLGEDVEGGKRERKMSKDCVEAERKQLFCTSHLQEMLCHILGSRTSIHIAVE